MKKPRFFSAVMYLLVLILLIGVITAIFGDPRDDLSYSQVLELFRTEQVKSFIVEENTIRLELHQPYEGKTKLACNLADPELFHQQLQPLFAEQTAKGVLESYDFRPESEFSPYDLIFRWLIVGFILLILWVF